MDVYRIDDGAHHWVVASSSADALAVWEEQLRRDGLGEGDLDLDGTPPDASLLTPAQASATPYREDGLVVGTMLSEYERDPSRRYVGCSEW